MNPNQPKDCSAEEMYDAVTRLKLGESVEQVSEQYGVSIDKLEQWQKISDDAIKDAFEKREGSTKSKAKSFSLTQDQLDFVKRQADKNFGENQSEYIASLLKRDEAGNLWLGVASKPDEKEKVIEAFFDTWVKLDKATKQAVRAALNGASQPKVFHELISALMAYLLIHHEARLTFPGDFRKTVEQIGELLVMPQFEAKHLRRDIQHCEKTLQDFISNGLREGESLSESVVQQVVWRLNSMNSCMWFMDLDEAKASLAEGLRYCLQEVEREDGCEVDLENEGEPHFPEEVTVGRGVMPPPRASEKILKAPKDGQRRATKSS